MNYICEAKDLEEMAKTVKTVKIPEMETRGRAAVKLLILLLSLLVSQSALAQKKQVTSSDYFDYVIKNYYKAETVNKVSLITFSMAEDAGLSGDSLIWVMNRVARSNFKLANYERAKDILEEIEPYLNELTSEGLYVSTLSLIPLIDKNIGLYDEAEMGYEYALSRTPATRPRTLALIYQNYAELNRLQLREDSDLEREKNLNLSLYWAERAGYTKVKDRAIRNLIRHYLTVYKDEDKALALLYQHTNLDNIEDDETASGLFLLKGELCESLGVYEDALSYYELASNRAKTAGSIEITEDALDSFHRVSRIIREREKDKMISLFVSPFFVLGGVFFFWGYKKFSTTRKIDQTRKDLLD